MNAIYSLANASKWSIPTANNTWVVDKPTIEITIDDPDWEEAYDNWIQGKPPTDSKEWKKGVIAHFKSV
jgi:hypothetical protein